MIAQHCIMSKMVDHITSGSCNYTTSENDKTVTMGFHHSWVIVFFPSIMSNDTISIDCLSISRFTLDFMTLLSAMMFIKFLSVLFAILKTSKPYI